MVARTRRLPQQPGLLRVTDAVIVNFFHSSLFYPTFFALGGPVVRPTCCLVWHSLVLALVSPGGYLLYYCLVTSTSSCLLLVIRWISMLIRYRYCCKRKSKRYDFDCRYHVTPRDEGRNAFDTIYMKFDKPASRLPFLFIYLFIPFVIFALLFSPC